MKYACVFGGTGFVGRYIVKALAEAGYTVKIASRTPQSAYFLKVYADVGQIVPIYCDGSEKDLKNVIQGCDVVVNTIGILFEKRRNSFKKIHKDLPERIANICKNENIEHFIHISALACDRGTSKYARSKYAGEQEIIKMFPKATILRPSIIFGAEDNFFNLFKKFPILPLIGGGKTKFQPVYVGDIAEAVMASIQMKKSGIYECGGAEVLSFKDLLKTLNSVTNTHRPMIYIPRMIAYIQGFFFGLLPNPLLTVDQVRSLKTDNVVSDDSQTLKDLRVKPTSLKAILPRYL